MSIVSLGAQWIRRAAASCVVVALLLGQGCSADAPAQEPAPAPRKYCPVLMKEPVSFGEPGTYMETSAASFDGESIWIVYHYIEDYLWGGFHTLFTRIACDGTTLIPPTPLLSGGATPLIATSGDRTMLAEWNYEGGPAHKVRFTIFNLKGEQIVSPQELVATPINAADDWEHRLYGVSLISRGNEGFLLVGQTWYQGLPSKDALFLRFLNQDGEPLGPPTLAEVFSYTECGGAWSVSGREDGLVDFLTKDWVRESGKFRVMLRAVDAAESSPIADGGVLREDVACRAVARTETRMGGRTFIGMDMKTGSESYDIGPYLADAEKPALSVALAPGTYLRTKSIIPDENGGAVLMKDHFTDEHFIRRFSYDGNSFRLGRPAQIFSYLSHMGGPGRLRDIVQIAPGAYLALFHTDVVTARVVEVPAP